MSSGPGPRFRCDTICKALSLLSKSASPKVQCPRGERAFCRAPGGSCRTFSRQLGFQRSWVLKCLFSLIFGVNFNPYSITSVVFQIHSKYILRVCKSSLCLVGSQTLSSADILVASVCLSYAGSRDKIWVLAQGSWQLEINDLFKMYQLNASLNVFSNANSEKRAWKCRDVC